jgi:UDP-N-acetylglucosamine 4,6-dehydratase/5-epimerase
MLNDKVILVTGGTGSFGKRFITRVLETYKPKKLIVFSRDELKQFEMQQQFPNEGCMRYFIGDIRDKERLMTAFRGVDYVIHAAAMKQVEASEYNPFEAIKTNVIGAENIMVAAVENGVKRVIALSTDKAVSPANLYGATKLCAEKLFVAGNYSVGSAVTRFSVVRYGNVVGSRGSVIPFFMKKKESGSLPITDPRMTRFWITLDDAVTFVLEAIATSKGGEIFVPKLAAMCIVDLANALAPECKQTIIGIRPGEKIHEALLTVDEARNTIEQENRYVIQPQNNFQTLESHVGKRVPEGFAYSSDQTQPRLTVDQIKAMIDQWKQQHGDS